jgi:hypothetical protein
MIAIISKGGKTAHVQLPAEQKQLAGALVYSGENHASDYELKYNEENRAGLKISLDCHGLVENALIGYVGLYDRGEILHGVSEVADFIQTNKFGLNADIII